MACMINNLGGLSVLELNVAAYETIKYLGMSCGGLFSFYTIE